MLPDADLMRRHMGDLHAELVRNLRKVGVLTDRIAPGIESLGISPAAA
jgi:hypothetical protein